MKDPDTDSCMVVTKVSEFGMLHPSCIIRSSLCTWPNGLLGQRVGDASHAGPLIDDDWDAVAFIDVRSKDGADRRLTPSSGGTLAEPDIRCVLNEPR